MSEQLGLKQRYTIHVEETETDSALQFRFDPSPSKSDIAARRKTPFVVGVNEKPNGLEFDWSMVGDNHAIDRQEIESEIAARMAERQDWQKRVDELVSLIEKWGKELDWSTRRIEKRLDDSRIGRHRVPALLLQQETCRAILEPIGRSTPEDGGVVDLYLMPAYDDIASFYYYDNQWNLHYGDALEGEEDPTAARYVTVAGLSKEALDKVLADMRKYAA